MELNDRVSALKDLFFETNLFRTTGSRCVLHEDNAGIQFELPATRPRDARKFLTYLQQKFQLAKVDFKIKDPDPADIT